MQQYIKFFVTIVLIYISIGNLNSFKFKMKEFITILVLCGVSSSILLSISEFMSMIPVLIIPIICLYKHNKNIVKSIALPIISILITIIIDYLTSNIGVYIFNTNINLMRDNTKLYLFVSIFDFIFIYLTSKILGFFMNKRIKISHLELKGKFGILIIISLMLTLTIFYTNIIFESKYASSSEIIKINGILFFAYFILLMIIMYILFRSITKELEFKNRQSQFENLQVYTNNLEKVYTDMRAFRHDYINILSSIIGYIQNKDIDGLEKHFNEKILPLSQGMESNNFKIGLLKNLKIPEIKGIFSLKLIRAQELGIDVFIDITEPIEEINMDIIDLSRCVGILLDNSIEAAEKCDKPSIKIAIINKEKSVLIIIINSYNEEIPIYKIFQKGFSTKGENRGLGLYNLKEIIRKYNNISLDTMKENGEFKQIIQITNKI